MLRPNRSPPEPVISARPQYILPDLSGFCIAGFVTQRCRRRWPSITSTAATLSTVRSRFALCRRKASQASVSVSAVFGPFHVSQRLAPQEPEARQRRSYHHLLVRCGLQKGYDSVTLTAPQVEADSEIERRRKGSNLGALRPPMAASLRPRIGLVEAYRDPFARNAADVSQGTIPDNAAEARWMKTCSLTWDSLRMRVSPNARFSRESDSTR